MNVPNVHIAESDGYDKYKRLSKQINNSYQKPYAPLSGLRRFRFINKNIDKSDPHWRYTNMIEVYEMTVNNDSSIIYLTDYENDPVLLVDDHGGTVLQNKSVSQALLPFVYPRNAILEIYRPFLIEKKPVSDCCITDIYADWGSNLSDNFLYDEINDAYVVNNIEDLIKTNRSADNSCYKRLRFDIKQKIDRLSWTAFYGYIPIRTDKDKDSSCDEENSSAWL